MRQDKVKLKRIIKLGTAYAITLPRHFASDVEYVIVKETEDGLLIKKVKVVEEPPPPPTPHRGRGEPP